MTANNFNYTKQNGVLMKAKGRFTKQNGTVKRILAGWTKQNGVVEQVYAAPSLFARFIPVENILSYNENSPTYEYMLPYMDDHQIIFSLYEENAVTGTYKTNAYVNNNYMAGASGTQLFAEDISYFWGEYLYLNYDNGAQSSLIQGFIAPHEVPLATVPSGVITATDMYDYYTEQTIAKNSTGEYVGVNTGRGTNMQLKLFINNQNGVTYSSNIPSSSSLEMNGRAPSGIGLYDGRGLAITTRFDDSTKYGVTWLLDYDDTLSTTLEGKLSFIALPLTEASLKQKSTSHNATAITSNIYTDDGELCYFTYNIGSAVDTSYYDPYKTWLLEYNATTKQFTNYAYLGIGRHLIGIYNGCLYVLNNNRTNGYYLSVEKYDKSTLSLVGTHNVLYSETPFPGYQSIGIYKNQNITRGCNSRYIGLYHTDYDSSQSKYVRNFILLDLNGF